MLRRLSLAALAAVVLAGCPGSIDDPTPFFSASSSCAGDFDVETDLFTRTCGQLGCHRGGDTAAAGLDFLSEGVGERLLAHHSEECGGRPLIDPDDFENSYLLLKVGDEPPCGQRMPAGDEPPLTRAQRACLAQYLAELAGVDRGDASVPRVDGGPPPPETDGGPEPADAGPTDGGPTDDGGVTPPTAVIYQAESDLTLTNYVVDTADTSVIRIPDGQLSGTAAATFTGTPGTYTLVVHGVAEPDGQATVRVHVAGALVGETTYPLASGTVNEPFAFAPVEVTLASDDEIRLEGTADVDAAAGTSAWARIDRVELTP